MELSHPLQDCLYLALAERLGAPLVTADKKFVAKARASHTLVRVL
jgi:predicted nucleic acid-binding protein